MKEQELRDVSVCGICGKKIGQTNIPSFYRVRIERYLLNISACQRQQGLGMLLGGHGLLAMVMGPDEDLAEKVLSKEITVCEECSLKGISIAGVALEENQV